MAGYEPPRASFKVPKLSLTCINSIKDSDKFDDFRYSMLHFIEAMDYRLLTVLRDDNAQISRQDMKLLLRPPAAPPAAAAAADPHAAARATWNGLPAEPTWIQLYGVIDPLVQVQLSVRMRAYLCEALHNHPAMILLRQAGRHPWLQWQALVREYGTTGALTQARLQNEHTKDAIKPSDDLEAWLTKFTWRLQRLSQTENFSEPYKCQELLNRIQAAKHLNLSASVDTLWFSKSDADKPTFSQLCRSLKDIAQAHKVMSNFSNLSLSEKSSSPILVAEQKQTYQQQQQRLCFNCKGRHLVRNCARDCRKQICRDRPRHSGRDCPMRRRTSSESGPPSRNSSPGRYDNANRSPVSNYNRTTTPPSQRGRSPTPRGRANLTFTDDLQYAIDAMSDEDEKEITEFSIFMMEESKTGADTEPVGQEEVQDTLPTQLSRSDSSKGTMPLQGQDSNPVEDSTFHTHGVINMHQDFLSNPELRPPNLPWDTLTDTQKLDENDYMTNLNLYVFSQRVAGKIFKPSSFPIPPLHWPEEWRTEAPNTYLLPRPAPWYPSEKLLSIVPTLDWLHEYKSLFESREQEYPLPDPIKLRPETRCGIPFPERDTLTLFPIREPESHANFKYGPWIWYVDWHFGLNFASDVEMDYWSLKLKVNIFPHNWHGLPLPTSSTYKHTPSANYLNASHNPRKKNRPRLFCEFCDNTPSGRKKLQHCTCGLVHYCDKKCQRNDRKAHRRFCMYAQAPECKVMRESRLKLPLYGIGTTNSDYAVFSLQRLMRYEIKPAEANVAREVVNPPFYEEDVLDNVFNRIKGYPMYTHPWRPMIMHSSIPQHPIASTDYFLAKGFSLALIDEEVQNSRTTHYCFTADAPMEKPFILDSGCNRILVHKSTELHNITPSPTVKLRGIANATIHVNEAGVLKWSVVDGNNNTNVLNLQDALPTDQTPYTIISPGILDTKHNMSTVFQNGMCFVLRSPVSLKESMIAVRGRIMPNLLYRSDTISDKPLQINKRYDPYVCSRGGNFVGFSINPNATSMPISATELHILSGHAGKQGMIALAKQLGRQVTGLSKFSCTTCTAVKSPKQPFFKDNPPLDNDFKLWEAWSVDFAGPWRETSISGNRYKFVLKAMKGQMSFIQFFPSREAPSYTDEISSGFALIERQTGVKVKHLRADGEFIAHSLLQSLSKKGIIIKITPPGEPRANAVVERDMRISEGRATSMRLQAGMPPSLWEECHKAEWAIRMVTNIAQGQFQGKSPYELFFKRPFPMSFLKPFGCLAFIRLKETAKNRPMAYPATLVGYNIFRRLYRLLPLNKRKVVEARNVKLVEAALGYSSDANVRPWEYDQLMPHSVLAEPPNDDEAQTVDLDSDNEDDAPSFVPVTIAPHGPPPLIPPHELSTHVVQRRRPARPISGQLGAARRALQMQPTARAATISRRTKPLAPRDISSAISTTNITSAPRARKQTPASHPTNIHLMVDNNSDEELLSTLETMQDADDETFCLFTRELSVPEKDIHLYPLVQQARQAEWNGLWRMGSFQWVPMKDAQDARVTPVFGGFIDAIKTNESTGETTYKSRFVVYGNKMKPFQHFSPYETSAPICAHITVLTVCSVAIAYNFIMRQIDFSQAYAHAEMKDLVFVYPPSGFKNENDPSLILKVLMALYGSPQAGHRWNKHITSIILKFGYEQSSTDSCMFYLPQKDDSFPPLFTKDPSALPWILLLRTDDMLCFCMHETQFKGLATRFKEAKLRCKTLGEPKVYCGMQFKVLPDGVLVHQRAAIRALLEDHGYHGAKWSPTPCSAVVPAPAQPNAHLRKWSLPTLIGKLLWPATQTQPHIAYAVNRAAVYAHRQPDIAYAMIAKIFRHLRVERGIFFPNDCPLPPQLISWADADLAGCPFTRRSRNGELHELTGPISWSGKRQTTVSNSTQDAEIIALNYASRTANSLQNLLIDELRVPISRPTLLMCDNKGAITATTNGLSNPATRHLSLKYKYVVEQSQKNRISVRYTPSSDNIADIFTKPLPAPLHEKLTNRMLVMLSSFLGPNEDAPPTFNPVPMESNGPRPLASPHLPPLRKTKKKKGKKKT